MKHRLLSIFALLNISNSPMFAVSAIPGLLTDTLPDGTVFSYYLKGDEFFKIRTTTDGYLINKNKEGYFEYAAYDKLQHKFINKGVKAKTPEERKAEDLVILKTMIPNEEFTNVNLENRQQKVSALNSEGTSSSNTFPKFGSPKSLVILVNFKDKSFTLENPQSKFNALLNETGYNVNAATGSARDYFISASFGAVSPVFDVVGPYTLNSDMSVYGENGSDGNDTNPRQMVIDACTMADADINFADYDLDGDGYIDNVFIYFAGYNEAEGGAATTIWPHRWAVTTNVKFDGKRLYGYACTSELKNSSGSTMCGIGTFCHEFGHVFGLVDYYPTDGGKHMTLSSWNIMDTGSYNNSSRTPPTYSAYDRFYLGWLTPTLLSQPASRSLSPLLENNTAYIITADGTHNMIGSSPSPTEFFTLENRQKTSWDSYLPYHGMLITRINYDETKWEANTPNNIATAMCVDIMEADGIATTGSMTGDPFPGSRNVKSFVPVSMSGTSLSSRYLSRISEVVGGDISLDYMGGGIVPYLTASYSAISTFTTVFQSSSEAQTITLSGKNLINNVEISLNDGNHFEIQLEGENSWSDSLILTPTTSTLEDTKILVRFTPTLPDYASTLTDKLWFKSENADSKSISLIGSINTDSVTLFKNFDEKIKVYRENESIVVDLRNKTDLEYPTSLKIYNTLGQQLYSAEVHSNYHILSDLPRNTILLLYVDGYAVKFMN